MSRAHAIRARGLSKDFRLYERPLDEEIVQIAANHVAETLAPQA